MSLMDDAIGEALGALRESGQVERTLVFFFSDNGGPLAPNGSYNAPLRAAKGTVYEGGVRVPFLIAWPGKIAAGGTDDRPVSSIDVFATALAAAGAPYLTGEKTGAPHERLFWRNGQLRAVREGRWKLVHLPKQAPELYDLSTDLSETTDLAAKHPVEVARLSAVLDGWDRELIEPVFAGLGAERPGQPNRKTNKQKQ
jgi:arylsulfatase A-like enzyme